MAYKEIGIQNNGMCLARQSFYPFIFCNPSLTTSENLAFNDKLYFLSYTAFYTLKTITYWSCSHFQISYDTIYVPN